MNALTTTPPELLTSVDLAHSVLAACMLGAPASDAPYLKPEHFPADRDKAVWRTMLELEAEHIVPDYVVLVERLKRNDLVDHTDWASYCTHILTVCDRTNSFNLEINARTIYENYRRLKAYRKALREAMRAINLSLPLPEDETSVAQPKQLWSVNDILTAEITEPGGPWPGIIPVGLTVIGARPKHGKSILMLQVSAAIGSGGMLFGQKLEQRPVLYYALEDSIRRLKERLNRLGVLSTAKIDFVRAIKPLHLGGLAEVEAASSDYSLIVVDTISRAAPGLDFNRDAPVFGDLLGSMQTAALKNGMSIAAVVHTRKPNGMEHDPIDDVLGSTQMTAAADCVLAIYRGQQGRSSLMGRSRDMEDVDLTMHFDPLTVCWQLVGKTNELEHTETQDEILEVLSEGRLTAPGVARALSKDLSNTRRRLIKLAERGLCVREQAGNEVYYVARTSIDEEPQPQPQLLPEMEAA